MAMKSYELFCLDEADNIVRAETFKARDDAEASEKAIIHCRDHAVELWADDHRVSAFRPSAHAPACLWQSAPRPN
jgi:hypothetical protein